MAGRGFDAGVLGAIAGARRTDPAAAVLRPGARIALVAARGAERAAWQEALVAAGARVDEAEDLAVIHDRPAWREAELLVAAVPLAPADLELLAGAAAPPFLAVCDGVDAAALSTLIRAGALDVILGPVPAPGLLEACVSALARAPAHRLRARAAPAPRGLPLEGATGAALARTRMPVLIVGETGSGKSRLARMLHETLTPGAPFVEVNAAGLASTLLTSELFGHERGAFTGAHAAKPGLVALAHGGTIFLDEIGELAPEAQASLLSFLDTGRYRPVGAVREEHSDARVFCATNRDLPAAIAQGRFREDLYYRLASILVPLAPLRQQRELIERLARELMRQAAARAQVAVPELDAGAIRALAGCDWPGNVRQLRFVIERAVALWPDQVIGADEIGLLLAGEARQPPAGSPPEMQSLAEMERALVARAMREAGGNRTRAAELLGITPRGLYNKLRRNGTSFRSSE